jgi:lysophospholipase L1-like esterase
VKWVMLLEGINDIGNAGRTPAQPVSADELLAAYKQLIERAHEAGVKVIGCTLTPYQAAGYYTEQGEEIRSTINQFIRTSKLFDGVVDFEAATRDPQALKHIRPDFDPGDHLHPNDAGYEAMANAIDLALFTGKKGK